MYTLEYSNNQGCFHISTLEKSLKQNNSALIRKFTDKNYKFFPDYILIGIFETHEEAQDFSKMIRRRLGIEN